MIEKFNFFDVYVYLLPGMAFLGVIWLPFGIVAGKWPPAEWSSALLLLAAAYLVGHVLYYPAKQALPTQSRGIYGTRDAQRAPASSPAEQGESLRRQKLKHPSDYVLDADESSFTSGFKKKLATAIKGRFKGAVQVDPEFAWDTQGPGAQQAERKQRALAFMLCRSALVTGKAASYGEQFEGLYQFLRALTLVFLLATVYHLGWTLALWNRVPDVSDLAAGVALVGIVLAAVATLVDRNGQQSAWFLIVMLAIALFACPHFLKGYLAIKAEGLSKLPLLVGLCLLDALAFSRCLGAYQPLAWEFATAIYRDFYTSTTGQKTGGDGAHPS
jgi:hypothetical protein